LDKKPLIKLFAKEEGWGCGPKDIIKNRGCENVRDNKRIYTYRNLLQVFAGEKTRSG
jgi:hypothetical protein